MSSLVIFLPKDHHSQLQVMEGIEIRLSPERFGRRPLKSFRKEKKGQVILTSDEDKEKFGFSFIVG